MRVQRDVSSVDNDAAVDHDSTTKPPPPSRPHGGSNHVAVHDGHPPAAGSSAPNDSAEKTLAERIRDEVAARLADDPSYVNTTKELATAEAMFVDFSLVEANSLWAGDGKLTLADLRAVADDPLRPDSVRDAARRLLANPQIWAAASKDGVTLSNQDLMNFINGKKAELALARKEVEGQVREDLGAPPPKTAENGSPTGNDTSATGTKADPALGQIDQAAEKPAPSTLGGMEGAYENANNLLGWAEGEMDRLNALLAKTDDPKTQKMIENKMNQLTRRMQSITAMITQLATMMSNISKMYSDIAMNSLRNMK